MSVDRYVALGLGAAQARWFADVARWATVGSIPVEFVKCISADGLRARLGSGRRYSVALVDVLSGAADRDMFDLAASHGVATIVVAAESESDRWLALGARAVLSPNFSRDQFLDTLSAVATVVGSAGALPLEATPHDRPVPEGHAFVAVMGAGGTGTSSVSVGLAQGLAETTANSDATHSEVVLVDLALDADQAMLHDARDVVPGLQELVELHRGDQPTVAEVRGLTFGVVNRGYQLLLGLRRHRDWTALRPRSLEAALDGLQRAFPIVVADVDADVEGEAETGSVEVEERNLLARSACRRADVTVVVGASGAKGLHALARLTNRLLEHSVPGGSILVVVSGGPRSPKARAEYSTTFADLAASSDAASSIVGPVFLPWRRGLDDIHRDGARFPAVISNPLAAAVRALHEASERPRSWTDDEPAPIAPGSLGSWLDEQVAQA